MPRSSVLRTVFSLPLLVTVLAISACGSDDTSGASSTTPAASTPIQLNTQTVATAIKQSIKEQRGVRAHVTCPQNVIQAKGQDFVCLAEVKKVTTKFAVQQTDDEGHVTYAAAQ